MAEDATRHESYPYYTDVAPDRRQRAEEEAT
jgi:hypothetical protein